MCCDVCFSGSEDRESFHLGRHADVADPHGVTSSECIGIVQIVVFAVVDGSMYSYSFPGPSACQS